MRKACYVKLMVAIALLLLAVILFLSSRLGPGALDSEKHFIAGLHNSLYYLDLAKRQWAEKYHKSEQEVPTMKDLTPYLGNWTNGIEGLVALGINYRITSMAEPQSDVATLTRDLRFRSGTPLYRAGTSYCLQTRLVYPEPTITSSFRAFYINNQALLAAALFMLAAGNLLLFVIEKMKGAVR